MAPHEFASRLTYPNPFQPSGIDFDLPDEANVSLQVLDKTGHVVKTILDHQSYPFGTHHIEFFNGQGKAELANSRSIEDNIFYYRLSIEIDGRRYVDTKKIVFDK